MTQKLKTETFSQKIEHSGGVFFLPLIPLFSFVTFHLKDSNIHYINWEGIRLVEPHRVPFA